MLRREFQKTANSSIHFFYFFLILLCLLILRVDDRLLYLCLNLNFLVYYRFDFQVFRRFLTFFPKLSDFKQPFALPFFFRNFLQNFLYRESCLLLFFRTHRILTLFRFQGRDHFPNRLSPGLFFLWYQTSKNLGKGRTFFL